MEQNQGLNDMMRQLLDEFRDLKATQIETREAIREIQVRTEAVEAQTAAFERRAASAPATPTAPVDPGSSAGVLRPSTAPPLGDLGVGSHDHRAPHLFRGDAPGILGHPLPAPGTDAIQSRPVHLDLACVGGGRQEFREDTVRVPAPKIEFPKFDGENPK